MESELWEPQGDKNLISELIDQKIIPRPFYSLHVGESIVCANIQSAIYD